MKSQHYPIVYLSNMEIAKVIWIIDYSLTAIAVLIILFNYMRIDKIFRKRIECKRIISEGFLLLALSLVITIAYHVLGGKTIASNIIQYSGFVLSVIFILYIVARAYLEKKILMEAKMDSIDTRAHSNYGLIGFIGIFVFVIIINMLDLDDFDSPVMFYLLYTIITLFWFYQLHVILRYTVNRRLSIVLDLFVYLFQITFLFGYFINNSLYFLLAIFVLLSSLSVFVRSKLRIKEKYVKTRIGNFVPYLFCLYLMFQFLSPVFINGTLRNGPSWYFLTYSEIFIRLFSIYTIYACAYLVSNLLVSDLVLGIKAKVSNTIDTNSEVVTRRE